MSSSRTTSSEIASQLIGNRTRKSDRLSAIGKIFGSEARRLTEGFRRRRALSDSCINSTHQVERPFAKNAMVVSGKRIAERFSVYAG